MDHDRQAEVDALRQLVLDADPRLVEIVKWNSPSFTLDGEDVLTISAGPRGPVRLILHRGTGIKEHKSAAPASDGLLTWHSDIRASLRADADPAAITAAIRAWLSA